MTVGILAYGSLISNPGEEIQAATVGVIRDVQTPFAVEFARSSSSRGGAPTLVPVTSGGGQVLAIIYQLNASEKEAADILYRREIHQVGSGRKYNEPAPDKRGAVRIVRHANFYDLDTVLSTSIEANIDPLTADRLAELAIASARSRHDGKDGITYLIRAMESGITTPLTPDYKRLILRRLGVSSLQEALATLLSDAGRL